MSGLLVDNLKSKRGGINQKLLQKREVHKWPSSIGFKIFVQCTYADVFYWEFLGQRFQQRVQKSPDLRRTPRGKMPHDIANVSYEYNSAYVKRKYRIVRLLEVVLYARNVQQLDCSYML